MTRHLDIELTSISGDSWTWRAVGAKFPKGLLEASLVPSGTAPGSVVRAEIESGLDGIEVIMVAPIQATADPRSVGERIEVLGAPKREPGVAVVYAPAPKGRSGKDGKGRPRRSEGSRGDESSDDNKRDRRQGGPRRDRKPGAGHPRERKEETRIPVSTAHRNIYFASLDPEQVPIAEALMRGGIPAVRKAIAEHQVAQRGGDNNAEPILAMAENLMPGVSLAAWKDRAAAAQGHADEIRMTELRSIVTASRNVSLDDEGKAFAKQLSELHEQRVTNLKTQWFDKLDNALSRNQILEALQLVQRPPEHGARLPADVALKLAEAVSGAMNAQVEPKKWLAILDAAVESPVRRTIKPAGIPDTDVVKEAARHAAGMLPELAKLLGLRIPPPPPRRVVVKRTSEIRTAPPKNKPKNKTSEKRSTKPKSQSENDIEEIEDLTVGSVVLVEDASALDAPEATVIEVQEADQVAEALVEDVVETLAPEPAAAIEPEPEPEKVDELEVSSQESSESVDSSPEPVVMLEGDTATS